MNWNRWKGGQLFYPGWLFSDTLARGNSSYQNSRKYCCMIMCTEFTSIEILFVCKNLYPFNLEMPEI